MPKNTTKVINGYKYTYDSDGYAISKVKVKNANDKKETKPSNNSSAATKPSTNQKSASDRRSAVAEKNKGKVYQAGVGYVDRNGSQNSYNYESTYKITDDDQRKAQDVALNRYRGSYNWQKRTAPESEKTKTAKKEYINAAFSSTGRISDNYKNMSEEAREKSRDSQYTAEEQNKFAKQADAYKQAAISYKKQSQFDKDVAKNDFDYDTDKDKSKYVNKGKNTDSYIPKTAEEKRAVIAKSTLGSINEDDTLKAASLAMTEDEKDRYYYVLGKNGEEAAKNYIKALYDTGDLGQRYASKMSEGLDKAVKAGKITDFTRQSFGVGTAFVEGVTSVGESVQGIGLSIQEAIDGEVGYNEMLSERIATKLVNTEREKTGNIGIDIGRSIGQMLPAIAVSVATMGAGAPAMVSAVAASGTTFGTVYGKTYIDTRRQGYDAQDSASYAAIIGGLEAGLQYALSGISAMSGGMLTKNISKSAATAINAVVKNPIARKGLNLLVTQGINSIGEFTEEYLQGFFEPLMRNVVLNENNEIDFFSGDNFYQGAVGALTAFLFNVPVSVSNASQYISSAQKIGKNIDPKKLMEQIRTAEPGTEAAKDAAFLLERYGEERILNGEVPATEAGLLVLDNAQNAQKNADIKGYLNGELSWNELTDIERSYLVDPKNAEIVSETFGVDVNSDMSAQEISDTVKSIAKENEAIAIDRSSKEIIDYLSGAKTWEETSDYVKNLLVNPKNADIISERTGLDINSNMTQAEILQAIDSFVEEVKTKNRIFDNPVTESDMTQTKAAEQQELSLEENAKVARYEEEAEMNKDKSAAHKELRDATRELKNSIKNGAVEDAQVWLEAVTEAQNKVIEAESALIETHYRNKEARRAELNEKRKAHREYVQAIKRLLSNESAKRNSIEKQLLKELKALERGQKSLTGEKYKASVDAILDVIDNKRLYYMDKTLKKAITIEQAIENFNKEHDMPIDQSLIDQIAPIKHKTVRQLEDHELYTFYKLAKHINHRQKIENKIILHDRAIDKNMMINNAVRDIEAAPKHSANKIAQIYTLQSVNPTTLLNDLEGHTGESLSLLADDVNNGYVKQETFKNDVADVVNGTMDKFSQKELQRIFGKNADVQAIELTDAKGKSISIGLTSGEKIALYMNSLNDDNMRHILGNQVVKKGKIEYDGTGSLIIPSHKLLKKGQKSKAIALGQNVKLTVEQVEQFKKTMTDTEMQFVKMFQEVYKLCQEAANATSIEDIGFAIATEDNYYPIITEFVSMIGDFSFDSIGIAPENASALKARTKESTKAIVLTDALETMFRHVNQIAAYYGMNAPLKNLRTVVNDQDVQKAIKANYGYSDAPIKYIEKLIKDLGIGHSDITALDKLRGNFAKAVLGLNPSVALSQISAYPAAGIVLNQSSLVKGLGFNAFSKKNIDIIRKHSPLYRSREAGNTDIDIKNISDINRSKLKKNSNWIVQMDLLTVRQLWGACEAQIKSTRKDLKVGTEEYYEEVAKLHTEVIQKTQVNTSTMQLSAIQRSAAGRMAFMFRSEAFKNLNILYNAYSELRAADSRYKSNKTKTNKALLNTARKKVAVATTTQLASAATFAGIKALIASAFDNEWEEEDKKSYFEKFVDQFGYNFLNSFSGNFIGGSETIALTSRFTGIGYENNFIQIPAIDNINAIMDSIADLEVIGKYIEGEAKPHEVYKAIKNFAKLTGNFTGVPVGTLEKYITGIVGGISTDFKVWYENLNYGLDTSDIKNASSDKEAVLVTETMLKNTSPQMAETAAGKDLADIIARNRNNEDFSPSGAMIGDLKDATINSERITFTKEEKEKAKNIANKKYKDYANSLFNSKAYKYLDDKEKLEAYTYLADLAETEARNAILKDLGYKPKDSEVKDVNIGDYAAFKITTQGTTNERMEMNSLLDMKISQDSKKQIYEKEFGKFTKTMNAAVAAGMTVDETISATTAMKWIDETSNHKKADKIDWILDNASTVDELRVLYTNFVENESNYHNTLEYAEKQGVRPEAFIQREAELNGLTDTQVYSVEDDLVYKDGELTSQNKLTSTSDNTKKNKAQMLVDGDYTDEELVYFWQKEYPSDDDFSIANAIGLSPREYIRYYAAQESNPKKADVFSVVDSLFSGAENIAMKMFANNSYSYSVSEQQQVVNLILEQPMSRDMRIKVLNKLGFGVTNDGNIYRIKKKN